MGNYIRIKGCHIILQFLLRFPLKKQEKKNSHKIRINVIEMSFVEYFVRIYTSICKSRTLHTTFYSPTGATKTTCSKKIFPPFAPVLVYDFYFIIFFMNFLSLLPYTRTTFFLHNKYFNFNKLILKGTSSNAIRDKNEPLEASNDMCLGKKCEV